MNIEKTKNYQKLNKLMDSFSESKDTILAMYRIGSTGGVSFCGETDDTVEFFRKVLVGGFAPNATELQKEVTNALITAIEDFVLENSKESTKFSEILGSIYDKALRQYKDTGGKKDEHHDDEGFDEFIRKVMDVFG